MITDWQQRDAIARIDNHLKYAGRDSSELPPDLARIIERLCEAGRSFLDTQRLVLGRPGRSASSNKDQRSSIAWEVKQGLRQIEEALRDARNWQPGREAAAPENKPQ